MGGHYIIHNSWLCKWPQYEQTGYCLLWQWVCLRVCFCVIVITCVCCHVLAYLCVCVCVVLYVHEHFSERNM